MMLEVPDIQFLYENNKNSWRTNFFENNIFWKKYHRCTTLTNKELRLNFLKNIQLLSRRQLVPGEWGFTTNSTARNLFAHHEEYFQHNARGNDVRNPLST